jgi:hypothetical protein
LSVWIPESIGPPVTPLASYAASTAPGYAVPGFGAARLPPQAPADWLVRGTSFVHWTKVFRSPPVEFRPLRSRPHSATAPFVPKQRGPRTCGSAAGCAVPEFTTAGCSVNSATGSVPLAGLVTLRYRLRGATGRLGYRPARRAPALRWSFPPPIVEASVKVRRCLPNQGWWSAIEHNAGIMRSAKPRCLFRRIICIMCKLPPFVFDPPPGQRVAARGAPAAARLPLPMLAPRFPSAPRGSPG